MKLNYTAKKYGYILACFIVAISLFGCKEKTDSISVFYGLPESPYLTEIKTSIENRKPVVIAFTAKWCPHCRAYAPTFSEVKEIFANKASFINIDVETKENSTISNRLQVRGIPTTVFIRTDGSVFKLQVGGINKDDLTKTTQGLIKSRRKKRGEPIAPFPIEPQEVSEPEEEKQPQELIEEPSEELQEEQEEAKPELEELEQQEEQVEEELEKELEESP